MSPKQDPSTEPTSSNDRSGPVSERTVLLTIAGIAYRLARDLISQGSFAECETIVALAKSFGDQAKALEPDADADKTKVQYSPSGALASALATQARALIFAHERCPLALPLALAERAIAMVDAQTDPFATVTALTKSARVFRRIGRHEEALDLLERAVENAFVVEPSQHMLALSSSLDDLVDCAVSLNREKVKTAALDKFLVLGLSEDKTIDDLKYRLHGSGVLMTHGRPEDALRVCAKVVEIFDAESKKVPCEQSLLEKRRAATNRLITLADQIQATPDILKQMGLVRVDGSIGRPDEMGWVQADGSLYAPDDEERWLGLPKWLWQ
jgi:tetratricopeptide (TPR) repeat protein